MNFLYGLFTGNADYDKIEKLTVQLEGLWPNLVGRWAPADI